jgi:predicted nuclease of restriction endonuclease-like RecB superfamily
LLRRRAMIETDASVAPYLARETIFEACGGMTLHVAEKNEALQKAAKKLSISVPKLEKALWADLEENQVLQSFLYISPAELLKQYNISLTQALFFRAIDFDIWIRDDFQTILRNILRSGLMYSLDQDTGDNTGEKEDGKQGNDEKKRYEELKDVHLHIEGPASLFRMSERYGNSFAKIFPILMKSKGWRLKAGILYKGYQGKSILEFTLKDSDEVFKPVSEKTRCLEACYSELQLNERKEGDVTGKEVKTGFSKNETETLEDDTEIETYDSTIEHIFSNLSLGSWKIKREPTIFKAGKYAFVPDFSLERDGMKVYLEIVGFWTPEYLAKKIKKLKEVKEPVILLINRRLKCSEKDFPAQEVIFFDRKIPINEVMKVLKKYEKKRFVEDYSILQKKEIPLSGELVNLEEIAVEKKVLLEALKEVIADRHTKSGKCREFEVSEELENCGDYALLGNYLIHIRLLERIKLEFEKPGAAETYASAVKVFEKFKFNSSLYYPILEKLGYKVIWAGLSEEEAKIKKISKINEKHKY